jgi:peptidoglycan/LPS O-acetylase OafA/YrhL
MVSSRQSAVRASNALSPSEFRLGYRPWLDGMRGWAILLVLALHVGYLKGGWVGVDVFFVLSGFLITTLLVEEWRHTGRVDLKRFYLRRALRLLLAFTVMLTCFAFWKALAEPEAWRAWGAEILVAALYVQNWPTITQVTPGVLGHTWSLSLEEQFYLVWPALFVALISWRSSVRIPLLFALVGILICVVHRAKALAQFPSQPNPFLAWFQIYIGFDTRADSLLVGSASALLVATGGLQLVSRFRRLWSATALASAMGLLYAAWTFPVCVERSVVYLLIALGVSVVILRLCVGAPRLACVLLEAKPLVGIGRISYGLYLYHQLIFHWFGATLAPSEPFSTHYVLLVAGALAVCFAASIASYLFIECPFLRLKSRVGHPKRLARWPEAPSLRKAA